MMFITNRWAEVDRSFAWLAEDQQAWHFVEQRLSSPWIHITVTRERGEDTCVEVFFLEDMRGLEQFTRLTLDGAVELSLQIVTPGWMNGSGGWTMEHWRPFMKAMIACTGVTPFKAAIGITSLIAPSAVSMASARSFTVEDSG